MKSFLEISIKELSENIAKGEMSTEDVADICINRVEQMEPSCQAWECFDEKNFKKACRTGLFHGMPIGVKDIFNTADFPTQMGSPLWKNFTPGNDARAVHNLKNAGAVIPGKTVTAEFAVHALGKTLNPHDANRNPGTSSSGSAVAVATGMVPAAIGTQTAGSIVRPASYCGVYGCKPSFGLIPRTGVLKTCDTLDTIGFFVSHACDLKIMFEALRVHGRNYPMSHEALNRRQKIEEEIAKIYNIPCGILKNVKVPFGPKNRPWKIAFIKTNTWNYAETYAKNALLGFAQLLYDHTAQLPDLVFNAHEIHATIYDKSLSHYFREEYKNSQLVSPIMNGIIEQGQKITIDQYLAALQEQVKIQRAMDGFFNDYDIIISLSTTGVAPLREEPEKPDPALIWTLAHLPVVSVPAFKHEGLPFGIQIVARKYNDYLLFDFIDYLREMELIPEGVNPRII
ncbi:MAG: amidase [Candidatus Paceibacterota bacterium]